MSLCSGLYAWLSSLGKPALEFLAPLLSEILSPLSQQIPPFHHLIAHETVSSTALLTCKGIDVYEWFVRMCECIPPVCSAWRGHKIALDPQKQELKTAVLYHVGSGK